MKSVATYDMTDKKTMRKVEKDSMYFLLWMVAIFTAPVFPVPLIFAIGIAISRWTKKTKARTDVAQTYAELEGYGACPRCGSTETSRTSKKSPTVCAPCFRAAFEATKGMA